MITFMGQQDYWQTPADIRVITVNCVGVMGKGIAKESRMRFLANFLAYSKACKESSLKPGEILAFQYNQPDIGGPTGNGLKIWNAATKDHWRDPSQYEWVERIVYDIARRLRAITTPVTITIPALGCGNGKLSWSWVAGHMANNLRDLNHNICVFNALGQGCYEMRVV